MEVGTFTIQTTGYKFNITEHNNDHVVSYDITIIEPAEFASNHEIEQPVRMKYNSETGEFVWDSPQDIGLPELESLLSKEIINLNA